MDWFFFILLFAFNCYLYFLKQLHFYSRQVLALGIFLNSYFLDAHKVPGFKNPIWLQSILFSSKSAPYTMYLNFDKPLIGLFLILFGFYPINRLKQWKSVFTQIWPLFLIAPFFLMLLATNTGFVQFDLKLPPFTGQWLAVNLLFTCVPEEVFFRGFLLHLGNQIFSRWRLGNTLSWLLSSALFGLYHLKFGPHLTALSTFAGLFYGLAYLKTNRIESSILLHFWVNAIHFLAFSYPCLSSALK